MPRPSPLNNPLFLGFDEIERLLDRASNGSGDAYPPYNIERLVVDENEGEQLRITLAVAGFKNEQLSITLEHNQLIIRGRQTDDDKSDFLHRGIAARQFLRTFILADGIEVIDADLKNGLLSISLHRPQPEHQTRNIEIKDLS